MILNILTIGIYFNCYWTFYQLKFISIANGYFSNLTLFQLLSDNLAIGFYSIYYWIFQQLDFISIAIGYFTNWTLFHLPCVISPFCLYFHAIWHFTNLILFQLLLDKEFISFDIGRSTDSTLFAFLLDNLTVGLYFQCYRTI